MPTWPTSPAPYSVSPFGIIDPVLRMQTEQGYEVRRSRWSKNKRIYNIHYLVTATDLHVLTDFIEREIRGGALSFDWTYPYPHTITSISNGTPNAVQTNNLHGFQTGDQVVITGTASHNGQYTITRTGTGTFSLDGTSGGSSEVVGSVAFHLDFAVLQLQNDTMPVPEFLHDFGPLADNTGLFRLNLVVHEEWA